MSLDLDFLVDEVRGAEFPRPPGPGAISGHAAGEPFDKHVENCIGRTYRGRTYRQYELLNAVLAMNSSRVTYEDRCALLGPPALRALLVRGRDAMRKWNPDRKFEEKQDDTADIVVLPTADIDLEKPTVHLIDVKSRSLDKRGMPQNIISALKIAKMSAEMIDANRFDSHDIIYVGVDWDLQNELLVARECSIVDLFKASPEELYINWSAALQIQFHVHDLDQTFDGSVEEWCRAYLQHFTTKAEKRLTKSRKEFIDAFAEYLYDGS